MNLEDIQWQAFNRSAKMFEFLAPSSPSTRYAYRHAHITQHYDKSPAILALEFKFKEATKFRGKTDEEKSFC